MLVACLCARWCRLCGEYAAVFADAAAREADAARFVWIDIEDDEAVLGPVEVDDFPTLLIARGAEARFFGPLTPQPGTLARLLRSARAGAQARPDAPRYALRAERAEVGSNVPRVVMRDSLLPFDKPYAGLSPEQQALVKGYYEAMGPADEPPFPRRGLREVYRAVSKAAEAVRGAGPVRLELDVDADGRPQALRVLESPGPAFNRAVAVLLMDVAFKPASCEGTPCRMAFPVPRPRCRPPGARPAAGRACRGAAPRCSARSSTGPASPRCSTWRCSSSRRATRSRCTSSCPASG
ncbi:energy transducer TonB [Piscinibacter sakaiensis]|uniref:energy transducer TonB n=1 Tax=Piscinibacter sakaiensis TaxID=1547922 RepID=UPI003729677C